MYLHVEMWTWMSFDRQVQMNYSTLAELFEIPDNLTSGLDIKLAIESYCHVTA